MDYTFYFPNVRQTFQFRGNSKPELKPGHLVYCHKPVHLHLTNKYYSQSIYRSYFHLFHSPPAHWWEPPSPSPRAESLASTSNSFTPHCNVYLMIRFSLAAIFTLILTLFMPLLFFLLYVYFVVVAVLFKFVSCLHCINFYYNYFKLMQLLIKLLALRLLDPCTLVNTTRTTYLVLNLNTTFYGRIFNCLEI